MSEIRRLRVLLRRTYRGPVWHGPALRELLEGVDAEAAAARPIAGSHSIWEQPAILGYPDHLGAMSRKRASLSINRRVVASAFSDARRMRAAASGSPSRTLTWARLNSAIG